MKRKMLDIVALKVVLVHFALLSTLSMGIELSRDTEPRMIPQSFPGRCRRAPPGVTIPKVPGDNGFFIKISGNPEKYQPGE
ncbi:hypothetical protein X975_22510, partial [Stegodyphus mimosarum]